MSTLLASFQKKLKRVDPDNLFNDDDTDTDDAESASGKDDE